MQSPGLASRTTASISCWWSLKQWSAGILSDSCQLRLSGWNQKALSAAATEFARLSLCIPIFIVFERGSTTARMRLLGNLAFAPSSVVIIAVGWWAKSRSEEHTSELQSRPHLVCRLLLEKKKKKTIRTHT